MWLTLTLFSAFFLGLYDVAKKHAVTKNAVLPVLFLSTSTAALCTAPLLLISLVNPDLARAWHIFIPHQPLHAHLLIFVKSLIVGSSWVFSYFGLKHLPISIASPLRATAPLFTVLGATVLFGERLHVNQWVGIILILGSYLYYSVSGKSGSSSKVKLVWIIFMMLSSITGALSAGFDKYLLQTRALPALFVLAWFLFYLALVFGTITLFLWFPQRKASTPFNFRTSIPLIGILLVVADTFYMTALSLPQAKLSLVSSIRRSNVIISFIGGFVLFREGDFRKRIVPFAGIVTGLLLIIC